MKIKRFVDEMGDFLLVVMLIIGKAEIISIKKFILFDVKKTMIMIVLLQFQEMD